MRILWHIIHGENRFSELKKSTFRHFREGTLYKFKRTGRGRDTGQRS